MYMMYVYIYICSIYSSHVYGHYPIISPDLTGSSWSSFIRLFVRIDRLLAEWIFVPALARWFRNHKIWCQ